MRTTLTIDDDLAQRLKAEMRKRGASLKVVVGQLLRQGLDAGRRPKRRFRVKARALGVRAGVNYSKTSEMLDWLDEHA
ncbi:MAG: DUF2191 domain-containing protein [Archangiaceae bacterium]|nr:DUF2191 domain-containing protein [Archangiaceae bacterium]